MTDYGLPTVRDEQGDLQAVEHTFDYAGQEVTIKLVPPTISQQEEYEEMGEDVDADALRELLDEHLVEPDVSAAEDLTMREVMCYVEGIVDYSTGGGMAADVREELEQRDRSGGN
jgi:hypothetical protein